MNHRALRFLCREFEPFLADPKVTDVIMNRPHEIGVARDGEWSWHESRLTYEDCLAIGILAAYVSSQDLSPARPICGSNLPDGQRIQIERPSITTDRTVSLCIRNPTVTHKTTDDLAAAGMFDHVSDSDVKDIYVPVATKDQRAVRERLEDAVKNRLNILICGAMGSGKSTLLNALSQKIRADERVVSIEDRREIKLPHRNWVPLRYSKGDQGTAKVTAEELMEASFSMSADRVLLGELRDGAAWTYLRTIVAGHPGGITTLHAGSAKGAFTALRLMLRQNDSGRSMPDAEINAMLLEMVDVVAFCEHDKAKKPAYRVAELYEKGAQHEVRPLGYDERIPGAAGPGADRAAALAV